MCPAGSGGRAAWVLAGGVLAAALALGARGWVPAGSRAPRHPAPEAGRSREAPAEPQDLPCVIGPQVESSPRETAAEAPCGKKSREERGALTAAVPSAAVPGPQAHSLPAFTPLWSRKSFSKRESPVAQRLYGDITREVQGTSENGVIFQKCAVVSGQSESQMVRVQLFVNNTKTPSSANLSDLLLLDNITGLAVRELIGNRTSHGLQVFRKEFLQVGEAFLVSYTASLDLGVVGTGTRESLRLPAQLTFQSASLNRTQLKALLTIAVEEKITVLPHHGLHAAGFFAAFLASFVLSGVALVGIARYPCLWRSLFARHQAQHPEGKLEASPSASADGVTEDLSLNDQMIDVLMSEDPGSMPQALEDLEEMLGAQLEEGLKGRKGNWIQAALAMVAGAQRAGNEPDREAGLGTGCTLERHTSDGLFIHGVPPPNSLLTVTSSVDRLEIATLSRADADLEACRTQISKDVITLLLKGLTLGGHLSPQVERRMAAVFKKQFLLLENEIQEEYDRKMLALTAECDLETRKKTESQHQREMVAMEEAEELLKRVSERTAAECSGLLRALHGLEREHLRRSAARHQDEYFAQAHRQLALFQRNELQRIFFTQIKSAICKGELKPEAAKMLLQDYSKIQEHIEELMDFLQATKRYHLSERFGHREYLVQNLQSTETRVQCLLSTAATQLTHLIQKHERAGYLDEDQMEMLLERAQTEVFSIKQKLDNDLKHEKKKLHQKLIARRRRELLQKHREHRREQLCPGEAFRAAEDAIQYLGRWRVLVAEHSAALEELQEGLDQAALDDLRTLILSLFDKATEQLRRLQSSAMTQELLKRSVPWLFLQPILEEQGRELVARAEQLEAEERARGQEGVQGVRQRLREDAPEAATEEQAELRHWEHLVFTKLRCAAFSLSEEELLAMRQEVHGCFAQMDRSLALPKVRARVLLQQFQTAWREAELLKLDQALTAPELQPKARKPRSKSRSKAELLRKCIEDKIRLFEEPAPADLAEKVRGELLRERVQWLEAQEASFVESLVALQFQKVARATETLSAYTSLLSIQDLLLEELSESEGLTKAACSQILESRSPELQELERRLEERLAQQEAAQQQQALVSWQQWVASAPGLPEESAEAGSEGRVSVVLQQALNRGQQLLERHQQRLSEEQESSIVLEDVLENMETDTFAALCSQELRLVAYLLKMTMVPGATLHRLLSVAMPTAPQSQLLALLDSVSERHSDHMSENQSSGEQADPSRRRKHQGWWQGFENTLRGSLRSGGLEEMLWARRRKESLLKKTCVPLRERIMFSGEGGWPHLSLEPVDELAPVPIVGTETIDVLNTGEKLFIFRHPKDPDISLHIPPRKKKNFLNSKKASRALGLD